MSEVFAKLTFPTRIQGNDNKVLFWKGPYILACSVKTNVSVLSFLKRFSVGSLKIKNIQLVGLYILSVIIFSQNGLLYDSKRQYLNKKCNCSLSLRF